MTSFLANQSSRRIAESRARVRPGSGTPGDHPVVGERRNPFWSTLLGLVVHLLLGAIAATVLLLALRFVNVYLTPVLLTSTALIVSALVWLLRSGLERDTPMDRAEYTPAPAYRSPDASDWQTTPGEALRGRIPGPTHRRAGPRCAAAHDPRGAPTGRPTRERGPARLPRVRRKRADHAAPPAPSDAPHLPHRARARPPRRPPRRRRAAMSTATPTPDAARTALRITAAGVRGLVVALTGILLAVAFGRVEALLLVLPLLVWSVAAQARRLLRGEQVRGTPRPRMSGTRRDIREGDAVRLRISAAEDLVQTAVWSPLEGADLHPARAAITGAGSTDLVVRANRWGRYRLDAPLVVLTDPFGAYRGRQHLHGVELRATPQATPLGASPDVPSTLGLSGAHLSRTRGQGTALADVRAFRPGDRLARINWRVSSRTRELHINETFTEHDTDVLVIVDTLLDITPPPGAQDSATSLDATVRAMTAITHHYLGVGDRVGVHDLTGLIGNLPMGAGPGQLRRLTTVLGSAGRTGNPAPTITLLRRTRPGTLVVVCSPLLHEKVIEQIGVLTAAGADLLVVDTLPPTIGRTAAFDEPVPAGQRGSAAEDWSSRAWHEAWVLRRLARAPMLARLAALGIPVTAWEGPASLAPVLTSLSRARSAPRMRRS
ncbi:MAG: DUF58 domain-containing protein [Brachybacterium sp.]|nr:DUF58 domain-containing protein [Brachybacterium sp.]